MGVHQLVLAGLLQLVEVALLALVVTQLVVVPQVKMGEMAERELQALLMQLQLHERAVAEEQYSVLQELKELADLEEVVMLTMGLLLETRMARTQQFD